MKNKEIKILFIIMIALCLGGCSEYNEVKDNITSYEKEETKCVEGNKIWIYKVGKENSSSITSQIIGECE